MRSVNFDERYSTFDDKMIRHQFISKVFTIVGVQLLVTCGFIAFFVFSDEAKVFAYEHSYLLWIAMGVTLVIMIAMACCESIRRQSPINIICLMLFTLAESFLVGVISCFYAPKQILLAIGITTVLVFALVVFAMQTSIDFTACAGIMFVAVILLIIFGIVLMFVRMPVLHLIYCFVAVFIFGVMLIIDVQMMMGGYHQYQISPEEYVFAALSIYIDVILIFTHILQILGFLDDS